MTNEASLAASDEILARLAALHPKSIDLSLGRLMRLLKSLGNPHKKLPPVIHIAGTNGKGSTTATIRAIAEAAGHRVHVYTSPHLVRFNERIRLAGRLIDGEHLTQLLLEVEAANAGEAITFFEVTTAAALLAFSQIPADLCLLEVGLGGRLDATNVIDDPIATIITPVSFDHQQFLGDSIELIAAEKAGILKKGIPVVIGSQLGAARQIIMRKVRDIGAKAYAFDKDWSVKQEGDVMVYEDKRTTLKLPSPILPGNHQIMNAGMAIAALRSQSKLAIPSAAIKAGLGWVRWPARLQDLAGSPLHALLPDGSQLWLDGGHNPAAAGVLRSFLVANVDQETPVKLVLAMMGPKDAAGFIRPLANLLDEVIAVPIPGEEGAADPGFLAATASDIGLRGVVAATISAALDRIKLEADPKRPPFVLIGGSLYLAGNALRAAGILPD